MDFIEVAGKGYASQNVGRGCLRRKEGIIKPAMRMARFVTLSETKGLVGLLRKGSLNKMKR
jgi:hypothetical protein